MNKLTTFLPCLLMVLGSHTLSSQNYGSLVTGVTSLLTGGTSGEIAATTATNSAAIAGKSTAAVIMASVTATNGKLLAVAHESFFIDRDINSGNNALFTTNAVNWLTPTGKRKMLISSLHQEWANPTNLTIFANNAISNGYTVANTNGAFTATNLSGVGVVVIGNAWGTLTQAEIDLLSAHLQGGGGILAMGLGWSWAGNANDYPMNKVVALAGLRFIGGTNSSPLTTFYPNILSYNLSQAQTVIDSFTTAYPTGLAAALQPSGLLQDKWTAANNALRTIVDVSPINSTERATVYNFYKSQFNKRPNYFKKTVSFNRFTENFLSWSRENIFKVFRDALVLNTTTKADIASTLGLTGRYLDIWNVASVLIADNNSLDTPQKDYLYQLYSLIPTTIHNLGMMTFKDLIDGGTPSLAYASIGATVNSYAVNSFSNAIGTFLENQFPADVPAGTVDIFCAAAPHEVTHVIDAYLSNQSATFNNRKNQLIYQAGTTDLQYLRSTVTGAFFQANPQEFLASIANQYQIDTKKVFQLARQRFDANYREPMNQALFFADTYAQSSNETYFYNTTLSGVLTRTTVPCTKDAAGFINKLTYDGVEYNFVRESDNGNIISYTVGNPTSNNNYCASKSTAPWELWASNVTFNTISNTSDKFKDIATLGYSDYTNLSTTVAKGQSYPLSITPSLSWIGNLPNAYCRVWIDFNDNNTFETSELVLEKTNTNPMTANVLIPQTAITGIVRMRVSMKWGSYPTACETFEKGEVEDYSIQITEGGAGLPDLTFSNITAPTSARLNEILNFSCRFKNGGTAPASTPFGAYGYVMLIKDNTTPIYLTSITKSNNIPAGLDSMIVFNDILPFYHGSGNYTLRFVADLDNRITESNENNNVFDFPITILPSISDNSGLKITSVTGPTFANPSSNLPLSITIKNEGTIASAPDSVFYATWQRQFFGGGSYPINYARNRVGVPAIVAGATVTINANFTLPATLRTTVVNDFLNIEPYLILKSKASRLLISLPVYRDSFLRHSYYFPIQPAVATDLALTGSQITTTWDSTNNTIELSLTVRNNGTSAAQNISVNIHNSPVTNSSLTFSGSAIDDFQLNAGSEQVSRIFSDVNGGRQENGNMFFIWKVPELAAGASRTATFKGKVVGYQGVPESSGAAIYYRDIFLRSFIMYADVRDANRTNDSLPAFTYRYSRPSSNLPDLTLSNLTIPTPSVQQGQILSFKADFKNTGTVPATGSFTVKSYLSTDNILSADDYQDGIIPTANYAAWQTVLQVTGAMTVRNTVPAGNYYLILKMDADNQIAESNENNNVIVSTSTIVVTAVQSTTYCASQSTAPWELWASNVNFGTISNPSDKFKDFATLGYSNYTNLSTTVSKGQSYPLSITPSLSWMGNLPNAYCRAWIDFNNNKTFEANELVLEKMNQNPFTQSVLIPITAVTSSVRMRVAVKVGAYPTACETFEKGEVEDYFVKIMSPDSTTNVCLNTFLLTSSDSCAIKANPFLIYTFQMLGTKIADGFRLDLSSQTDTKPWTTLFTKVQPTAIQPTRTLFSTCFTGNWQYFKVKSTGTGTGNYTFMDTSLYLRVHYWGRESNPDSIFLEMDRTPFINNPSVYLYLKSYKKTQICNTCPTSDVTAPIFTQCPSTTVMLNRNFTPTQVYMSDILQHVKASDNCNVAFGFNTFQSAYWGGVYPMHVIAYDSAGNQSVCNFKIQMPCRNTNDYTLGISDCPRDTNLFLSAGQTCQIYTWTAPKATNTGVLTKLTSTLSSGSCFPIGTTTVVYTAQDSCGKIATCAFKVHVISSPLPDLTLANLTIPTPSVQRGQILSFKVDAKNIGTAAATGSFTIKSYLSTDNVLSANDYADGSVPTGNYAAGFSISQIPAAMTVNTTVAAGQYYLILKIDADNTVSESNENNNVIVSTGLVTVTAPTTGGSDIALSITATPSVYRQYTVLNFKTTAINSGTTAFSNVKIKFTRPTSTSNGGTAIASIGSYSSYCAGSVECSEWTIPTFAGGVTATLELPIFVLAPTGAITATLLSSTPTDGNAGNNTVSVVINPSVTPIIAPLVVYKPTQLIPVVIQKLSPTLVEDEITLELASLIEKNVDFSISNAMGQTVLTQHIPVEKGLNKAVFDVSKLPQGLYFIQTTVGKGRNVPTRFVKM